MSRVKQTKTNFTSGEVSKKLLGRGDLRAYDNGALSLCNLYIHPTGGVSRRFGTVFIDEARGEGRLVNFEFNTEQSYLLVFTALNIDVYKDDVLVATVVTTYTTEQLKTLTWTQNADTLILCQKDTPPLQLTRSSHTSWSLQSFDYEIADDGWVYYPAMKIENPNVSLNPSGTSGTITLTASAGIFTSAHIGTRISINNGQIRITAYTSPTQVSGTVFKTLASSAASTNWKEEVFSSLRGWPCSVAFHQDRIVFGGSRDMPNRLWFSQSSNIYNFKAGTGLDNEAISFGILSDQVNAITGLFSGRHLQVFTSGAEWMVTGDPLTPQTVQVKRQTRVGSNSERHVMPIDIDGATIFAARNGGELREFLYTDVEAAYKSTDLSLLARHIIYKPVAQTYDALNRLLYVVMEDGTMGVMTVYREEGVAAWTVFQTEGFYRSVTTVGDDLYFIIERDNGLFIEKRKNDSYLDSLLTGTNATAKSVWSGLDHLEGQEVSIVADGYVQNNKTVSSGTITLDTPAVYVQIGLPYTHKIKPLPPSILSPTGRGKAARLVEAIFRVEDTAALFLDVGRGLIDILESEQEVGQPPALRSGDKSIRASGWTKDMTNPLWKIEQSLPLPFTLLSVTIETKVNE